MSHPNENLSAYLSGELNTQERAEVEEHLEGCRECALQLKAMHQLNRLLSQQPSVEPSSTFLQGVLQTIEQKKVSQKSANKTIKRRTVVILAIAAAVAFFAILISLQYSPGPSQVEKGLPVPEKSTQQVTQQSTQTIAEDPEMIAQLDQLEEMDLINNFDNLENLDVALLVNHEETK
jgi:anti-sigma factor RsiW